MVQPSDEAIREKAYYLWEAEGKPHGREHEFWQRAAVALSTPAKLKTLPKAPPKKMKAEAKPVKAAASKTKAPPAKATKPAAKRAVKPKKK
jgi:hypothetical protein